METLIGSLLAILLVLAILFFILPWDTEEIKRNDMRKITEAINSGNTKVIDKLLAKYKSDPDFIKEAKKLILEKELKRKEDLFQGLFDFRFQDAVKRILVGDNCYDLISLLVLHPHLSDLQYVPKPGTVVNGVCVTVLHQQQLHREKAIIAWALESIPSFSDWIKASPSRREHWEKIKFYKQGV